jgi:hypothetical protein
MSSRDTLKNNLPELVDLLKDILEKEKEIEK